MNCNMSPHNDIRRRLFLMLPLLKMPDVCLCGFCHPLLTQDPVRCTIETRSQLNILKMLINDTSCGNNKFHFIHLFDLQNTLICRKANEF